MVVLAAIQGTVPESIREGSETVWEWCTRLAATVNMTPEQFALTAIVLIAVAYFSLRWHSKR